MRESENGEVEPEPPKLRFTSMDLAGLEYVHTGVYNNTEAEEIKKLSAKNPDFQKNEVFFTLINN